MSAPVDTPVVVERVDQVMVITIDRPDARNAIDIRAGAAIEAALDELDADPDLRVGVITGTGNVFSAGMDLRAFGRGEPTRTERRGFAGLTRVPPDKPLVAAVNGPAVGGGFEIVLACDLVVAAESAWFALPEVKRGLCAAGGGLVRLPKRIPFHLAMELALLGEPLSSAEAANLGLVNRRVPDDRVVSTAMELADSVAARAPLAVVGSKRVLSRSQTLTDDAGFEHQEEVVGPVRASEDAVEGARAYLEKRPPRWQGR